MDTVGQSCSTVSLAMIDTGHSDVFVFMILFFFLSMVPFKIAQHKMRSFTAELLSYLHALVQQVRWRSTVSFPPSTLWHKATSPVGLVHSVSY